MGLDLDSIGRRGEPAERSWTVSDSMLYALAIGVGADDPTVGLEYTTENSDGIEPRAIPCMIAILSAAPPPPYGEVDRTQVLHAEQAFHLDKPLPVEGRVRAESEIVSIEDKTSGALLGYRTDFLDLVDGTPLGWISRSLFIRGAGGFGGSHRSDSGWTPPPRGPDAERSYQTRTDQALLYRLTGDRNPLHSDPVIASRAGFGRPILHGMCTYGFTCRALVELVAAGDAERLRSMTGRFTRPVLPGERLTIKVWDETDGVRFQTCNDAGEVVIDRGLVTVQ